MEDAIAKDTCISRSVALCTISANEFPSVRPSVRSVILLTIRCVIFAILDFAQCTSSIVAGKLAPIAHAVCAVTSDDILREAASSSSQSPAVVVSCCYVIIGN